jgi:hypothetical protein
LPGHTGARDWTRSVCASFLLFFTVRPISILPYAETAVGPRDYMVKRASGQRVLFVWDLVDARGSPKEASKPARVW